MMSPVQLKNVRQCIVALCILAYFWAGLGGAQALLIALMDSSHRIVWNEEDNHVHLTLHHVGHSDQHEPVSATHSAPEKSQQEQGWLDTLLILFSGGGISSDHEWSLSTHNQEGASLVTGKVVLPPLTVMPAFYEKPMIDQPASVFSHSAPSLYAHPPFLRSTVLRI